MLTIMKLYSVLGPHLPCALLYMNGIDLSSEYTYFFRSGLHFTKHKPYGDWLIVFFNLKKVHYVFMFIGILFMNTSTLLRLLDQLLVTCYQIAIKFACKQKRLTSIKITTAVVFVDV